MTDRLRDKVAIVTGGGDGIGRGVVRRFATEGAKVLVAEIDDDAGELVARVCRDDLNADVRFLHTDASAKDDVRAMVAKAQDAWGTVDILVNNAWGGGSLGRLEHATDEQMQWGLSMGLLGPFWAMQAALPIMKAKRDGAVINMCSLNGVNAHMGTVQYNVAKEALRCASRTAAREWAPWQIRVNVICPGAKTAASRAAFAAHPELETAADAANPMGRLGDPEDDIAPVAVFLASDDARYVTGNTLFVDGGGHINGVPWAPDLGDERVTELQGMVAVVAGAGPGIGRACATALGHAGADVIVAARDAERLAALATDLAAETGRQVLPLPADLADVASCRALVDEATGWFGRIDVLVNVATYGGAFGRIDDSDWQSWRTAFEVNVIGTLELSRAAARVMTQTGGGSIIQIGTFGTHGLPAGRARYTSTKQAMVTASLTLAKELGPSNVRVNVVTPGFTAGSSLDTMEEASAARTGETPEDASRRLAASAALGRHVEPSDVAAAVLFLAGPGARSITGVELPVTAGR